MIVDSHCHLNCLDVDSCGGSVDSALRAAWEQDVKHFLCVCIELEHFPDVLAIAKRYENVDASLGLHPNEKPNREPSCEELIKQASHSKVVAIGETGLDYFRSTGNLEWQRERFRRHISVANHLKKPLIIHTRDAKEDTIRIMQEENAKNIGGIMHCFTETWETAKQAMAMGFYISFSGIVTFKNAKKLQDVARKVPLDRLLIETDSPFLAPMPYRGKPNQPAYARYIAECIAGLRSEPYEKIAEKTTANYFKLVEPRKRS